jgi:hypothetical protein
MLNTMSLGGARARVDGEGADAEGVALARPGDLEQVLDGLGALDQRVDVGQPAIGKGGEPSDALRPSCGSVSTRISSGREHAPGDVNDREPVQDLLALAPVGRGPFGACSTPISS